MSYEHAVAFYALLQDNQDLEQKLQGLGTAEKIGCYVKEELGYTFTKKEAEQVFFEKNPEISDEEMEKIWGGYDTDPQGLVTSTPPVGGSAVFYIASAGF
jgi:predicted ribosomally synthesized peptide with nif11-like leader